MIHPLQKRSWLGIWTNGDEVVGAGGTSSQMLATSCVRAFCPMSLASVRGASSGGSQEVEQAGSETHGPKSEDGVAHKYRPNRPHRARSWTRHLATGHGAASFVLAQIRLLSFDQFPSVVRPKAVRLQSGRGRVDGGGGGGCVGAASLRNGCDSESCALTTRELQVPLAPRGPEAWSPDERKRWHALVRAPRPRAAPATHRGGGQRADGSQSQPALVGAKQRHGPRHTSAADSPGIVGSSESVDLPLPATCAGGPALSSRPGRQTATAPHGI